MGTNFLAVSAPSKADASIFENVETGFLQFK
jgi:hypothetical protein